MSTRRGFLRQIGSGAVIAAAVPIVGSSLVAPASRSVLSSAPVVALAGAASFHQLLGAVRDVYSSEIYLSALPVMKFYQFTTRSMPRYGRVHRVEAASEVEDRIRARVACQMDANRVKDLPVLEMNFTKRRRFFDLGWLRRAS